LIIFAYFLQSGGKWEEVRNKLTKRHCERSVAIPNYTERLCQLGIATLRSQ